MVIVINVCPIGGTGEKNKTSTERFILLEVLRAFHRKTTKYDNTSSYKLYTVLGCISFTGMSNEIPNKTNFPSISREPFVFETEWFTFIFLRSLPDGRIGTAATRTAGRAHRAGGGAYSVFIFQFKQTSASGPASE